MIRRPAAGWYEAVQRLELDPLTTVLTPECFWSDNCNSRTIPKPLSRLRCLPSATQDVPTMPENEVSLPGYRADLVVLVLQKARSQRPSLHDDRMTLGRDKPNRIFAHTENLG